MKTLFLLALFGGIGAVLYMQTINQGAVTTTGGNENDRKLQELVKNIDPSNTNITEKKKQLLGMAKKFLDDELKKCTENNNQSAQCKALLKKMPMLESAKKK